MSGGGRLMKINTRERAVSSDINRLEAFAQRAVAELLRFQGAVRSTNLTTGVAGTDIVPLEEGSYADTTAAGTAAIATPAKADVFEGLVVLPQAGSLNLLVSPGAVGFDDPDGQAGSSDPSSPSTDDSRYKVVVDPGIQVAGAFVIAAGAGSTRIDLIEVRRTSVVMETDSRDVFDPSTGVFLPVSVQKVVEGRLLYRVTQGTPGAGIPAFTQGWLPICVASVPSSATSVDQMTFWDVRPLVKDRVNAPFDSRNLAQERRDANMFANDHTAAETRIVGQSTSQIGCYRAGGRILPIDSGLFFDARAAANHAAGYTPVVGAPWYLYAVFPANLPRWVQYLPAPTTPRVPFGPLGVIVVSHIGPSGYLGTGDTQNPPAATGLGTAGPCALLAAGVVSGGPVENGFVMSEGRLLVNPNATISGPAAVAAATTDTYTLIANTHFPETARSVIVRVGATFAGTPGNADQIHLSVYLMANDGSRLALALDGNLPIIYGPGGTDSVQVQAEVPRAALAAINGEPDGGCIVQVLWSTVATRTLPGLVVQGWRL